MRAFRRVMLGSGLDIDSLPETQKIYYTASAKVEPKTGSLYQAVIANKYDATTGNGVIVCPNAITTIRDAFSYNSFLTSVSFPDNVTHFEGWTCQGCENLTEVSIPEGAISIGNATFQNCSSLRSINIPDSVTTIGGLAFTGCTSLPVINNARYADSALVYVPDKTVEEVPIIEGTRFITSSAFSYCYNLTNIVIPNSIISIASGAFTNCAGEAYINCDCVQSSLVSGTYYSPFQEAYFSTIEIGDSVTSIGSFVFKDCPRVTRVDISDSVTTIGTYAFERCERLNKVIIGRGITTIGKEPFYECGSLQYLYCKSVVPPVMETHLGAYSVISIYVPTESVDAYKAATNWSKYADYIVGYDFNQAIE